MKNNLSKLITISLFLVVVSPFNAQTSKRQTPLIISEQGSFAVGGTIIQSEGEFDPIKQGNALNPTGVDPSGQTLHGDHAAVYYQIPVKARKYPLVFWHGHDESSRCWQTTPDGREGFQNIFLRKKYPVYLIDQPRRGNAGKSIQSGIINSSPDEQSWFGTFRLGIYPDYYPNVQFSKDPKALDQFYRQMVPNTAPYNGQINIDAVDALFDTIGEGILVTHSQSGGPGWLSVVKNPNIKAVISYEAGGDFVFPQGEAPASIVLGGLTITPPVIPKEEFLKLTKIPIVIYYGDHIPDKPSANPGEEIWRLFLQIAKKWAETVNRYGGDVTVVYLPDVGIKGNTHFPFSDLNNIEIANLASKWLKEKGLD